MNRSDLQQLAEDRALDAKALLDAGRWSCAYYICGYAVECALKACIAKQTGLHDFPDKDFVQKVHSHNLIDLLELADLKTRFDQDAKTNATLGVNWGIVKDWNEATRYEQKSEPEARELYHAVTDAASGVLPWIKQYW